VNSPRRRFLIACASIALAACDKFRSQAPERGPIVAMFPGSIDDGGFVEAGYRGLMRVRNELRIPVHYVDKVAVEDQAMKTALRELADSDAKMVIAYGDPASDAVQRIAWEFPDQRFTLIQGHLTRPNLAIYEVIQEQASWLAGAAAGMLTRSDVVGHISGERAAPALRARAAFAAGLAATNPKAKLLTHFSGTRDDAAAAKRVALAEINAGADILYVMLDRGRMGATEACRERGVKQIGETRDSVASMPDVFVASALADAGVAVFQCARDLYDNLWKGDIVRRIGVRNPEAVELVLAPDVPERVRARVVLLTQEIAAGSIKIPTEYAGSEFVA
jgi:basic membrane protein A